ncbi:cadherin-like beta sandwich domain-containing protein [Paenibacillus glacialis]|uniref:SLH domain-containing protein n=1 Tax=Paenibacillus glacialis TaxID=494026 RepID=A0A168DA66_9BACL|nr:cadherin-like beta sandwich domain-containing protein [Paenibacillus glacialis]OAB34019.1 hypothetical protein PGLA_24265 [Paenibacillus glacialis]
MAKMNKKVTTILLVMLVVLSGLPGLFATDEGKAYAAVSFAGGTGLEGDPFRIATAGQLNEVRNDMASGTYYILTNDIDLSSYRSNDEGKGWTPIGVVNNSFKGTFNGNGKTISNLYINRPTADYQALFGFIERTASISDVNLINVNVTGGSYTASLVGQNLGGTVNEVSASGEVYGISYIGGLVGVNDSGKIENSNTNVIVTGTGNTIGGLIGHAYQKGTVNNNYAVGIVTGKLQVGGLIGAGYNNVSINKNYAVGDVSGDRYIGGLIGQSGSNTSLARNYATGNVTGKNQVGGLIGNSTDGTPTDNSDDEVVTNSFALGNVTGDSFVGGLIGFNDKTVSNMNYATGKVTGNMFIGGLIGYISGGLTTSNGFYNKETTGQSDTGKGDSKTTIEMQRVGTYTNWTFTEPSVWTIDSAHNNGYPYLSGLPIPENMVYSGNGSTGGTPPIGKLYTQNQVIIVDDKPGDLVKTGYTFTGWNTKADGSGNPYLPGQSYTISADTTFYAQWLGNPPALTADTTNNDNRSPIEIMFTDDGTWGAAITEVKNAGISVSGATYTVSNGKITINAGFLAVGTHTITVMAQGYETASVQQTIVPSSSLSGLSVSSGALNQVFAETTTSYTQSVANNVTSLTVTPTVADPMATVEVSANGVTGTDIQLNVGANTITVTVTASNGSTKVYTIIVTRISNNALLASLTVDQGTLSPTFTSENPTYTVDLPNIASSLNLNVTIMDTNQTISVVGADQISVTNSVYVFSATNLIVGPNPIELVVIAEDGTRNPYHITVNRAANSNADLGSLTVSSGTLSPAFESGIVSYTSSVDNSVSSLIVTASTHDSNATMTVNGKSVVSGQASGAISLNVGNNPITIVVTAQNGTSKTYTVTVTRAANSSTPSTGGGGTGGGSGSSTPTDSKLKLPAGKSGKVSLGDEVTVSIPEGATDKELILTISKWLDTQNLVTNKQVLATSIYEILKNFPENFKKPVTLTFKFDQANVKKDQRPAVFYYDEVKKVWVEVTGGRINGNRISVEVDHFKKYAVFVVDSTDVVLVPEKPTEPDTEVKFSDIAGHWAQASIKQAVNSGIVKGYANGTFKPNNTVTRAEFAVMLMNALKPQGNGAELTFTDKAEIGTWAQKAVAQGVQVGIINGYSNGTFGPNAEVTRAEMAVMIAIALGQSVGTNASTGFADDKDIPAWAKGSIAYVKQAGIVNGKGDNRFVPQDSATRAEAVTVLLNMLAQKNK